MNANEVYSEYQSETQAAKKTRVAVNKAHKRLQAAQIVQNGHQEKATALASVLTTVYGWNFDHHTGVFNPPVGEK